MSEDNASLYPVLASHQPSLLHSTREAPHHPEQGWSALSHDVSSRLHGHPGPSRLLSASPGYGWSGPFSNHTNTPPLELITPQKWIPEHNWVLFIPVDEEVYFQLEWA